MVNINLYLKNFKKSGDNIWFEKIYGAARSSAEPPADEIKIRTSSTSSSRRFSLLKPAIVFTAALVMVIFSFTGTVYASRDSLPGETIYPVKRTAENIQLSLWPESKKGNLHFRFMNNRIYEADKLMESGETASAELIEELMDEIDKEYQKCKKYNYFENRNEEEAIATIERIKNRYSNKYGQHTRNTEEINDNNEDSNSGNINNEENIRKNKNSQNNRAGGD